VSYSLRVGDDDRLLHSQNHTDLREVSEMNKRTSLWMSGGALALVTTVGLYGTPGKAQQPPATEARPVLATPFDKDANGWTALGEKTKAEVESDTVSGKNALRFDYTVAKGAMGFLLLPVNANEISTAKAVRMQVKTDYPTTVVVTLQEQDAGKEQGRYMAYFYSPGGKWQDVSLGATDFILSTDTNDPKDPNNKLDMDKVAAIGMGDVKQMMAQADDSALTELLGVVRGDHKIWLRDFKLTTETLPGVAFMTPSDARLDTFGHPQAGWMGVGDVKLSNHSGSPLTGRGLKATYTQGPSRIAGIVRTVPMGRLTGKKALDVAFSSDKDSKIIIQVEERGGGKYNVMMDVPAGASLKEFNLPFNEFRAADDSKDTNDQLDLDKVYQVIILDLAGPVGMAPSDRENNFYVSRIRATP
jgi:hypothetical protein